MFINVMLIKKNALAVKEMFLLPKSTFCTMQNTMYDKPSSKIAMECYAVCTCHIQARLRGKNERKTLYTIWHDNERII